MQAVRMLIGVIVFLIGVVSGAGLMYMSIKGRINLPVSISTFPGISDKTSTNREPLDFLDYRPKNFELVSVERGRTAKVVTLRFNSVKYPKEVYIIKVAEDQPFSWSITRTASIYRADVSDYISVRLPIDGEVALFYVIVVTDNNVLLPFGEVNSKTDGPIKPFKVTIK